MIHRAAHPSQRRALLPVWERDYHTGDSDVHHRLTTLTGQTVSYSSV